MEPMIFKTYKDAEEMYYKTHDILSDDVDKEEGNIIRWIEGEGHHVIEGNI